MYLYEHGVRVDPAPGVAAWFEGVDATDVFTIRRAGSGVQYLRNGKIFHVSTVTASGSYVVDTAFIYTGTAVGDVMISTDGSGVTRHVYDTSGERVMRVDPNGTKTLFLDGTELAWAPGATDVTVARTYPGGVVRDHDGTIGYRIADERGSVIADVAAATGTVTHRRYLPYGQPRSTGLEGRAGYLGHIHDPGGLIELTHRYLDPTLGAFTSVDPLITQTGEPYIYASANPTTLSDPTGLCATSADSAGRCYAEIWNQQLRAATFPMIDHWESDPDGTFDERVTYFTSWGVDPQLANEVARDLANSAYKALHINEFIETDAAFKDMGAAIEQVFFFGGVQTLLRGGHITARPTPPNATTRTDTVDDLARAIRRPPGVADDWIAEVASNGRGTVWRAPGTSGNAGTVRIMGPTAQYPNGYARFYNRHGQPIDLNGNPGPNSATHFPLSPNGSYTTPKGWGGAG